MPTTLLGGRPLTSFITQTMASKGLVMTMTKAPAQCRLTALAMVEMTPALMPIRSSRLMPGLRGTPAVTMTTSAPRIARVSVAPS